MGDVVSIVEQQISRDTAEMLRAALAATLRGEAIGATLVLQYRGRHFSVDAAGAARQDPVFARGALCKLDDELAKLSDPRR